MMPIAWFRKQRQFHDAVTAYNAGRYDAETILGLLGSAVRAVEELDQAIYMATLDDALVEVTS